MTTHLQEMLRVCEIAIANEEKKIYEGLQECLKTKTSLHDGYWKHLWSLNQKRLAILQVMDAFKE